MVLSAGRSSTTPLTPSSALLLSHTTRTYSEPLTSTELLQARGTRRAPSDREYRLMVGCIPSVVTDMFSTLPSPRNSRYWFLSLTGKAHTVPPSSKLELS